MLLIFVPDPLNQRVLEKSISVLFVWAKPAMLPYMASTPEIEAELAKPQPADRAQGLINNCVAPADPARSGLPAMTAVLSSTLAAITIALRSIVRFISSVLVIIA